MRPLTINKMISLTATRSGQPDGIDVYFENVGGAISDEVFKYLNRFARVPVCSAI